MNKKLLIAVPDKFKDFNKRKPIWASDIYLKWSSANVVANAPYKKPSYITHELFWYSSIILPTGWLFLTYSLSEDNCSLELIGYQAMIER